MLDKQGVTGSSPSCLHYDGDIAQMGERLHGMQEAVGSSPIISTHYIQNCTSVKEKRTNFSFDWSVFCISFVCYELILFIVNGCWGW